MAYEHLAIERHWQEYWDTHHSNTPDLDAAKRPFYTLMMFPYPSAEGLHVGNVFAFTGVDIQGRFHRHRGFDVFEPIGFDAFGIHSENYAMKVGTHPMKLIPSNVANFTRQLKRMGLMVDWSREVSTTDPRYYKWTQWIFLKLYERGLAYRANAPVNWCPKCATVISDEQVIDGMCERHPDTRVEKKVMEQWFFRITDYAQELLDHLAWIDWSDIVRRAQINWIGRSEGALLRFPVPGSDTPIEVFTTRPDTVFGATYMVLAPEHARVEELTSPERRAEVDAYREAARRKDSIERMDLSREKTGVFLGASAINPATGKEIPIWISDYVLTGYGTGAIMAVPAHDERDYEFATKFALPIIEVLERPADAPKNAAFTHAGAMKNSAQFDRMESEEAKKKITAWLGERGLGEPRVQFRLRDWCISRQRYWGPPIPMIHCEHCGIVPVPEKDLPVLLPVLEDFRPEGSGDSPLARVESFYRVDCPKCGGAARRDTDVSDNFLDSAWYFLRYPSAHDEQHAWDPERTKKWFPVDYYIGGREHSVLHLMYTRFLCLAFRDMGLVPPDPVYKGEPFKRFRAHGLLIKDGDKMSKSRGNVVIPDKYVEEYGADTFRMFLMFLGPYELGGDFRDSGIIGIRRFLERVHRWYTEELPSLPEGLLAREAEIKLHQTIKKVTTDLESLGYNTAIAALMECHNELRSGPARNRFAAESFVVLLSPFAPHLAEELWATLGHEPSVQDAAWPVFDPNLTVMDTIEIAIQINGKMRDAMPVARDAEEAAVLALALEREKVRSQTAGKAVKKVIYVKNRLMNLIVA